jgi:amino acid permease
LAATAFGSGILAIPWAFGQLGLLGGLAAVVFSGFASLLSQQLLVNAAYATGLSSYTDITKKALGRLMAVTLEFVIIINTFGNVLGYFVFIGQFVPELCTDLGLPSWLGPEEGGKLWVCIIVAIFPSTPLCCLRSLSTLSYATLMSFVSLAIVCILIVYMQVPLHEELMNHDLSPAMTIGFWLKPHLSGWKKLPACMAIFFYSFCCHLSFFAKYRELDSPTSRRVHKVLYRSVVVEGIIYIVVGTCGYLALGQPCEGQVPEYAWPSCTPVNILASPRFSGAAGVITRICMLLTLCVSIPLNHAAGREILANRFTSVRHGFSPSPSFVSTPNASSDALSPTSSNNALMQPRLSWMEHLSLSLVFLWSAVYLATKCSDLETVLGILGGFCCVSFMFTVPTAITLILYFGRTEMPDGSLRLGIIGRRRLEGTDQIGDFWGVTKRGAILACIVTGSCVLCGYTAASLEIWKFLT